MALEFRSAPAIMATLTADTLIAHNRIANTGYSGIVIYGSHGWGDTRGNRVVANRISGTLWRTADGGGIYSVFAQRHSQEEGLLIEGNVVVAPHDPSHGINMGLYTDMGSRHVTVRCNVEWGYRISTPECTLMATRSVCKEQNFLGKPLWAPCRAPNASRLEHAICSTLVDNKIIDELSPVATCRDNVTCREIVRTVGMPEYPGFLQSRVDGFEAVRSFMGSAEIKATPLNGSRWGVTFPRGAWLVSEYWVGYRSSMFQHPVASTGTLGLKVGACLHSTVLEGSEEMSIVDGVNPSITRTLPGPCKQVRVDTG